MPKYILHCDWTVSGTVEVTAKDLKEAIEKADKLPLPEDSEYVEGSWDVRFFQKDGGEVEAVDNEE